MGKVWVGFGGGMVLAQQGRGRERRVKSRAAK